MNKHEKDAFTKILKLAESAAFDAEELAMEAGEGSNCKPFICGVLKERLKTIAAQANEALLLCDS